MEVKSQRTQLPFVRTGLGTKEKLVVAGLVGAALLIQRLRGRTRRKLRTDMQAEPQKVQVNTASHNLGALMAGCLASYVPL